MYRFKNALNATRAAAAPRLWYRLILDRVALAWVAVADERALSLEDAVDQALQENPQVAASAAMLNAAQEGRAERRPPPRSRAGHRVITPSQHR